MRVLIGTRDTTGGVTDENAQKLRGDPPWPVMADANTSIYFRVWGYSRHGGTFCCPSPGRK